MRTTDFSGTQQAEQTVIIDATAGPREIEVPSGGFLPTADYSRIGADLSLLGEDGRQVLIRGYFGLSELPDLTTAEGARIGGELVAKLAGPLAPAQYAQATTAAGGEPVGTVTELTGSARATRADGSQVGLAQGDPVFLGDILETGGGSSISIRFLDDTLFSLAGDARLMIDQLVYNPGGGGNALSLSLLQGAFAFVSGQIAPADGPGMTITTPVANIGVRGTTGAGQFLPAIPQLLVTLLEGLDGELGVIDVFNNVSLQTLANVLDTVVVTGIDQEIPPPAEATEAQLAIYALALASLGRAYIDLIQDITPEAGPEQDGGTGSSGGGLLEDFSDDPLLFGEFFGVSDSGAIETFFVEISIVELLELIEDDPNLPTLLETLGTLPTPGPLPDTVPTVSVEPDPDNSSGGPLGFEAVFTAPVDGVGGSGPVSVVDSDVVVTSDGGTIQSATVTLTNPLDGDAEELDVDPSLLPAGITVDPASTTTTLILVGPASDDDFEAALALVTYFNEAESPDETPRSVTIVLDDGTTLSDAVASTIFVEAVDDGIAATVTSDPDNSSGGPAGFETTFVEAVDVDGGSGPVPVVDADVEVTSDEGTIQSATVTLTNPQDGNAEGLDVDPAALPTGITVDPTSTATTLILTGPASDEDFEAALALVTYFNEAEAPDETPRVISISVNDGSGDSAPETSTILVEAADDVVARDVGLTVSRSLDGPAVDLAAAALASPGADGVTNAPPFLGFASADGGPEDTSVTFTQLTDPDAGRVSGFDPDTGVFFYTPPVSGGGDDQEDGAEVETSFDVSVSEDGGPASEATVGITARAPNDFSNLIGTDGIDILYANPNEALFEGDGGDGPTQTLDGGGGDDFLVGTASSGGAGGEDGGPESGFGNEQLIGGAGDDDLFGLGGDDELLGSSGDDLLVGDGDVLSSLSRFDVFLLTDLSGTFFDDLPNVQAQFAGLFNSLSDPGGANRDVAFGVGSFIDKPNGLNGLPPGGDDFPDGDFVYNTDQAVTTNQAAAQAALDALALGEGLDFPEAQLEALLQVALRADTPEIGFRDGAQRFVVLSTDAEFHVAGDFVDAETPNNGDAVIDPSEDYPSIAQVATALANAGIVPIFAVTSDVLDSYTALADQLGTGVVVELSSDSDNIAQAVLNGIEAAVGGADLLDGGSGNDTLLGGPGDDTLTGGADADLFLFQLSENSGSDIITDFEAALDSLGLADVFDYDGNGTVDLADLDTALAAEDGWSVTDDGEDVTVVFGNSVTRDQNGGQVVIEGIGTESIDSFADLGTEISLQVNA